MDIQDRKKSLTAEELRQRYNLEDISKNKKAIQVQKDSITKLDAHLEDFIDATTESLEELQDQVDGNITTWFYSGVPTLSNEPAVEWTTDEEKNRHFGDLYYDQSTGYAYRFAKQSNQYIWLKLTDSDVTEALRIANEAQDTADNKRRVFTTTPTTPYDVGDLYLYNEDLYVCSTARESGSYVSTDFEIATKYTDDTALNNFVNVTYAAAMQNLTNQIDGKISTWYYDGVPTLSNLPASAWTTDEEKQKHTGDLYYDRETGYCYMFEYESSTFKWTRIEDSSIIDALAVANAAQDTADNKRRVFVVQPTPPYDIGDIWIKEDTDLYRCKIAAPEGGSYSASHWILATNYTDDTVALEAQAALDQFKIDVQETYATSADLITTANSINGRVDETYTYITTVETNTNNQIADITNATQNIDGNNSIYIEDAIQDNVISYSVDGATEQEGTPTPDNPQEVKTIPSIRNLLDISKINEGTRYGITVTHTNTINLNGTSTGSGYIIPTNTNTGIVLPAGTYKANAFIIDGSIALNTRGMSLGIRNSTTELIALSITQLVNGSNVEKTLTLNEETTIYIGLYVNGAGLVCDNAKIGVQIEEGSVAHGYVPHGYWSKVKVTGKQLFKPSDYTTLTLGNNGSATNVKTTDKITITTGSGSTNSGIYFTLRNYIDNYNADTDYYVSFDVLASQSLTLNIGATTKDTRDVGTTKTRVSIVTKLSSSFVIYSTNNRAGDTIEITNIMVATNDDLTYEPYKENQVLIDMSKENLFDKDNPNVLNAYIDGSKKITTSTTDKTIYISCKPNTTYTIVKSLSTPTSNNKFRVSTYDSTPALGSVGIDYVGYSTGTEVKTITITTSATANYLAVFCYNTNSTSTLDEMLDSIKIYEGTNPTPYHELNEIGDYKDILSIDSSGNVSISKNIGKVVLNGSGNYSFASKSSTTSNNVFATNVIDDILTPSSNNEEIPGYSNYFSSTYANDVYSNNKYGFGVRTDKKINFGFTLSSSVNTKELANTWLSTHNTEVYYPLATPETINLPNTKIPLFEGINHITFVDDLETSTSVTYYRQTPLSDTYATQKQLNDVSTQKTQEITQVRNEVQAEITATNATISVINETIENGVSKVNGTGYTFDSEGLKIEKTNQDVKSLLDNDGLAVSYQNTELLTVRSNGIEAENMTVRKFYVQKPIRMEKTKSISDGSSVGLGFFYVGE